LAGYLLTFVLAGVWLVLWRARLRARLWFLLAALGASILCFPLGVVVGRAAMRAAHCTTQDAACSSGPALDIWLNGFLAFESTLVLAAVTFAIEAGLTLRQHLRGRPVADGDET
jgi:hypothetical protein